jgi:hypothetical protein
VVRDATTRLCSGLAQLPLDQLCERIVPTSGTRSVDAPFLFARQANEREGEGVNGGALLRESSADSSLSDPAMRVWNDDQSHRRLRRVAA